MAPIAVIAFCAGLASAWLGAELLLRGVLGLSRWARVSPAIVALTVAAFSTSMPELSVSMTAVSSGAPGLALGNAIGSNVVNIALVLALAMLLAGSRATAAADRREIVIALMAPLLTLVMVADGALSRIEGLTMLALFFGWLGAVIAVGRAQRNGASASEARVAWGISLACTSLGLAFLLAAGPLMVPAARDIAVGFGVGEFAIGATLVAASTSVPELATAIVGRKRGHDDVAMGTILGSNIFNGLFIVGLAAMVGPMPVVVDGASLTLLLGTAAVLLIASDRAAGIGRWRAAGLLGLYVAYVFLVGDGDA